jgi:hypothetical protein
VSKIFISYKRGAEPDDRLADYFANHLLREGHEVFIDKQIAPGEKWPVIIRQRLEACEFFLVLVSELAAASEMVIEEVRLASHLNSQNGAPTILPVRLRSTVTLPYDLGAKLNRIQHLLWAQNGDEQHISAVLTTTIANKEILPASIARGVQELTELGPDGNQSPQKNAETCPLPAFDPQWLDRLDPPGGAVRLSSPFYMKREIDSRISDLLLFKAGVTLRIKGSRQMGKSSIFAHLYQYLKDNGRRVLYLDFQRLDESHFENLSSLLSYLANLIALKLNTNNQPTIYWQSPLGSKDKLSQFVEVEVLEKTDAPITLLIDEVDRVFNEDYRDDFFSLIRAWHGQRAYEPLWEKLNVGLAYSTEAFMFIRDLNQSPFNVGDAFELTDFNRVQIQELSRRHNHPVRDDNEMDKFVEIFGGHPYLVRKALYDLVVQKLPVDRLIGIACNEDGPFGDHLHRYLWRFDEDSDLRLAMQSVIRDHKCPRDDLFYRLQSAGLVKGTDRYNVSPRCGLYEQYFGRHL